ncbi:Ig-like domain-containing protein [Cellulomonas fimi]|uniref:LPXTG-motif cell wall anchor domain protein n=1 Tax=Cellulomonas fimi (strain ATCC 484 / DSM 20113 / JCM 1341 / CCUG 24087 / LMG 16345 / NBRC 15513 / NCIMB 8980 / NCTC 7547 / NRS-133) TaxID=590998 RepID=F4H2Z0_CELFA|nr:Ig-like domain-containing protein [Cellulomonas fimi]AEE47608.1 LPXTG-motif cell wall anchor domain protein [Cellulomonas fimi ATCC 484]NNH08724.1 hypothetical protein [Cellulomonas fimi]VEH36634.1 Uncharacterised protein [Cellulomonas fimi]
MPLLSPARALRGALQRAEGPRHRASVVPVLLPSVVGVVVLGLLLALLAVVRPPLAGAAGSGTLLLQDDFKSATTVASSYVVGGTNYRPCLTAGSSTATTPIPGCGGAADAAGNGTLRLTANVNNQAGFLLYDKALPTKAGLDITFNEYQYGGTQADGITFFLTDGQYTLSSAGAFGGSLGYHHQTTGSNGVAHALLGIGLDVYGNYTVETNDTATCGTTYAASTLQKNTVAVRGPGNGKTGYCLLGAAAPAPQLNHRSGATRPTPVQVRIVVDPPSTPSPKVRVSLDGTQVTVVDQPALLASTPTFKFGWGASTGGQNDFHEINFLTVESVNPIRSDLALTSTASTVPSGDAATVTLTARTDPASGPVPAGEPVTVTADAPAGAELGTPAGAGWDCTASTTTRASCTRTSATAVDPGTTFPPVGVTLTRTATGTSGTSSMSATVTSASDDPTLAANNTATATVRWSPVVAPVTAAAVTASASPAAVSIDPSVVGTGPYTFQVVSQDTPGVGSVAVVDGRLVVTPVAGASGTVRATYRATDAARGVSNIATVQLVVAPVATGGTVTTSAGTPAVATLPTPLGTGPFTAAVTSRGAGLSGASVVVDGAGRPVVTATPEAGFSGSTTVEYRVADGTGVLGAPVTLTVLVRPVAADDAAETTLDAAGAATLTRTLPSGTGSGTLTYALVGSGDLGGAQATLTPTGELTVVATTGVSGTYSVGYTVTDGSGTSDAAEVDVVVHPYLGAVATAVGTADGTVVASAPVTRGTGPVTWTRTTPTGTTTSVASDGRVTLDAQGRSGTFTVQLTARDAHGVASATQTVTFVVAPVAPALTADAVASATPVATVVTPTATVGTGPFVPAVAAGLAPGAGTLAVTGSGLAVTPAAGVSGVLTGSYTVRDASGLDSAVAPVTLRVRPAAHDAAADVASGTAQDVTLPVPTGTGPFTWALLSSTPSAAGAVTLDGGVVTVDAAASYSGPLTVVYTVTDADGLTSDPATLTVTVDPTAPDGGTGTTAQQPGTAGTPLHGPTPTPTGTGPFTFEIVTGPTPAQGVATIDPATGVVTFVPAPGFSGPVDVLYRAIDAHGTPATPATVTFTIAPLAAPTGGTPTGSPSRPVRTTVGGPVTTPLPTPVGTGPFTYELVDGPSPAQGTATIDPVTGKLRFVPGRGYSGRVTLTYRVVDGSGLPSAPQTVTLEVAPTAPATATAPAQPGASTTVTLPTPEGRGPFGWTLVSGPSADQGTVRLDPATGRLTFVGAPGWTGTARVTYTVTDADGVVSEVLAFELAVRSLATTGARAAGVAGAALALVLVGGALVLVRRRRGDAVRT